MIKLLNTALFFFFYKEYKYVRCYVLSDVLTEAWHCMTLTGPEFEDVEFLLLRVSLAFNLVHFEGSGVGLVSICNPLRAVDEGYAVLSELHCIGEVLWVAL